MNRREARKQAFLLLFQYSFQPDDIQGLIDDFFAENKTGNQREYIDKVVGGVIESRFEIDEQLNKVSKDWHVERFSPVCLAALRLAVFEMLYMDDIPTAVSVNEAVTLVKEYDDEKAVAFANGILGGVQKAVAAENK